jgi:putative transposase
MPDYRRNRVPGGTFFFTVNLLDRNSDLLVAQIDILRDAVRRMRTRAPCRIDAWVVLPDHMHCQSTLACGPCRQAMPTLPGRWRAIKTVFVKYLPPGESRSPIMTRRGERGIWQRRYWEHTTRRSGLCGAHGLHAFQPGETRSRRARGGLAAFVVSSVRKRRAVSRRLARRQR